MGFFRHKVKVQLSEDTDLFLHHKPYFLSSMHTTVPFENQETVQISDTILRHFNNQTKVQQIRILDWSGIQIPTV